jgi:signal peptidase II
MARESGGRARLRGRAAAAALAVVAADQATKALALARLSDGGLALLGPWLRLVLVHNTGAAFGLLGGGDRPLAAVGALAAAGLWWASGRAARPAVAWALGLVLGGAVGNLLDRLVRHAVVDFVAVGPWPVFNLADAAVTVGVVWLAWELVRAPAGDGREGG